MPRDSAAPTRADPGTKVALNALPYDVMHGGMSPQQEATMQGGAPGSFEAFMNKWLPIYTVSGLSAATGGMASAALAGSAGGVGGAATAGSLGASFGTGGALTTLGSTAVGAFTGAATSAMGSALTGKAITAKSLGTAAITGGVGGGLAKSGLGSNLTNSMTNAGLNPSLAAGVTKGAIGAGTSALGAKLNGGNVGNAALQGGVNGFINGAVSDATGSNMIGKLAAGVGGRVISPYLGQNPSAGNPSAAGHSNGTRNMATSPVGGGGSNFIGTNPNAGVGTGAGNTPNSLWAAMGGAAGAAAGQAAYNPGDGQMHAIGADGRVSEPMVDPIGYAPDPTGGAQGTTDSNLAKTITGDQPTFLQSAAGVYGSQNAAEKQTRADDSAINTQNSTLGNIGDIWSTQRGLGQGADNALGTALGTNGKPADYSGFENSPGYKFAVSQGTQAIQRQAASMGNAYTPNTAAAVGQYVTGTASQNYNNYISHLMGAAGLGSTANAGVADPTYHTGANISQLQQNKGYAEASGVTGEANAVSGIFGKGGAGTDLVGAAGNWVGNHFGGAGGVPGAIGAAGNWVSKQFGGGPGNSPGGGGGGGGRPGVNVGNILGGGSNGSGYSFNPSDLGPPPSATEISNLTNGASDSITNSSNSAPIDPNSDPVGGYLTDSQLNAGPDTSGNTPDMSGSMGNIDTSSWNTDPSSWDSGSPP